MKETIRRVTMWFMMLGLVLSLVPVTANAAVVSDNVVHSGLDANDKYFIISYFNPSHKVEEGEGYKLKAGKYVKQAYVRAKSDGLTIYIKYDEAIAGIPVKICAPYDSGRCYSPAASKKTNKLMKTSKEVVPNCATCKQSLSYGWFYF